MTAVIQGIGLAVSMNINAGYGQYNLAATAVDMLIVRSQAIGQRLIGFAFRADDNVNVRWQFAEEQTADDHSALDELIEVVHAAHSDATYGLSPEIDQMVRSVEAAAYMLRAELSPATEDAPREMCAARSAH
jgi:hypothetical protein